MGRKILPRTTITRALTITLAVALAATTIAVAQDETTLERIQREGKILVGIGNEAPFGFVSEDGTLTGEAAEILKAALTDIGVTEYEAVVVDFAGAVGGLVAGHFDVIAAGLFIRPARCELFDFGNPEFQLGVGLAVAADNPKDLSRLQDFVDTGSVIGLVAGGAENEYADVAGIPDGQRVLFQTGPDAIAGLQAGQVDAVMMTTLSIRDLVSKAGDPGIEYAAMSEQPLDADGNPAIGYGAMVFRLEDDDLRMVYNERLAELKDSGELLEILEPFGFSEENLTDVEATDICPSIE